MNAMDLIYGLNNVRDSYVAAAGEFRQRKPKRLPKKRLLLIAAIIALTLLLVGCAVVYVLRLQDLKVGEYRYTAPTVYDENGEAVPVPTHPLQTILSAQGANRQAFAEWHAYCQAHGQDSTESEDAEIPEQYREVYGCSSWEMAEKLDEIAAKYDLKLLSSQVDIPSYAPSVLFDALGIETLFEGTCEYGSGSFARREAFPFHWRLSWTVSSGPTRITQTTATPKKPIWNPTEPFFLTLKTPNSGTIPEKTGKPFFWR